jgi:hypothetical protein
MKSENRHLTLKTAKKQGFLRYVALCWIIQGIGSAGTEDEMADAIQSVEHEDVLESLQ